MRIVFIGTVDFSYKMLCKLITLNANIVGVCTKENSNFNQKSAKLMLRNRFSHANLKKYLNANNIQ